MASTIANEIVVNDVFVDIAEENNIRGCIIEPVTFARPDAKNLRKRKELNVQRRRHGEICIAGADGQITSGMRGDGFKIVKPERLAESEVDLGRRVASNSGWYELQVDSAPLKISPTTRIGNGPFDTDPHGEYRCSQSPDTGHSMGLNIMSELTVEGPVSSDWDIFTTEQLIGCRRGFLRPRPLYVVSQRFYLLLRCLVGKGCSFEVCREI